VDTQNHLVTNEDALTEGLILEATWQDIWVLGNFPCPLSQHPALACVLLP